MTNQTTERHFPFSENGARIRSFRKRAGKSQENLASEVGTTRRHMIRLENGEHLPSSDLRNRIASATGREPEEIQSADDEEEASMPLSRDEQTMFFDLLSKALSIRSAA